MPELDLKEAIEIINKYIEEDLDFNNPEFKDVVQLAISKLSLLLQVEGGVKKLEIRESEKGGFSYEYKLGFNEAIDLCNADLVRKLEKDKLYRFLMDDIEIADIVVGVGIEDNRKLSQAIITHLTK